MSEHTTPEQVRYVLRLITDWTHNIDVDATFGSTPLHTGEAVKKWLNDLQDNNAGEIASMVSGKRAVSRAEEIDHGTGPKGIDQVFNGQVVRVVLTGIARNVTHEGKQGPRLTVGSRSDGAAQSNGIYARDGHVVSVEVVSDDESDG